MTAWPDWINAAFELAGAAFVTLSIRRTLVDKCVRGLSWLTLAFFTSWGYWNLFYYPHLGQLASLVGAIALAAANTVWVWLVVYYVMKERRPWL